MGRKINPFYRLVQSTNRDGPMQPTLGTQCWLWKAATQSHRLGHGLLWVCGKMEYAHRCSWLAYRGPIPEGMCVLHRCDNPPCVNPDHLFLGTKTANAADRDRKQRQAKGEDISHSKLTPDRVREIRRRHEIGGVENEGIALAIDFNVTPTTISHIINRVTWKHV